MQDSRRRSWIDAAKQRFGSFVELMAWLGERCRALWQEIRHPEHDQFSVAEMLEHERPHLMPMPMPMPAPLAGYVEKPARASSTRTRLNFGVKSALPTPHFGQKFHFRLNIPWRACWAEVTPRVPGLILDSVEPLRTRSR